MYKLNLTPQKIKEFGFRYDMTSELYTYEFPVYKNQNKILLWCKIAIEEDTQQIRISIYDTNKKLYPAYYNRGRIMGLHSVVSIIDENIKKEFKRLGAKEAESNDKPRIRSSKKRK